MVLKPLLKGLKPRNKQLFLGFFVCERGSHELGIGQTSLRNVYHPVWHAIDCGVADFILRILDCQIFTHDDQSFLNEA